ncbi:VanZ family protein [Clostridium boliviensis]|uniref:VanZ family protein n=1 Tax=Clostridium boliviensis TaxID=318465 RepID=A0ABU4GTB1_9CLOT|nr:VanZ family protein [Clostridium boliviensis]MDW2800886.1 VanZ family protein [Clostridium boliviensis]
MLLKKTILHNILWVYAAFLFLFVAVKFNGSFNDITSRVNSIMENRCDGIWNINLVPFRSIAPQLKYITEWWSLKNIIGNIILFIPLGFLVPLIYINAQRFYKTFLIIFLSVLLIETFQLFTVLGVFDIDDIILNCTGGIIGYLLFYILKRMVY